MSEKSAFRPCGRDLVAFFNSTGWAFYVQEAVPMRLPDAGRLVRTDSQIFSPIDSDCRSRFNFMMKVRNER
jgi:hypothetical protein